jgi:hypothetical protein
MKLIARRSMFALSAILAVVLSASSNVALAAAALAGGSTGYTFASTGQDSTAEAEKDALANCEKNSSKCALMASFTGAGALALAKGSNGKVAAVDEDPRIAAKTAVKSCEKKFKDCKLTEIYWERGDRWASFALALKPNDKISIESYFAYAHDSKPEAEEAALAGCNKRLEAEIVNQPSAKGAVCRINNTFSGAGGYAEASSVKSVQTWKATNVSVEKARESALANCKLSVGADAACKIQASFSNPPTLSAPKSFAGVYATTEVALEERRAQRSTQRQNIRTQENNVVSCTNQCTNGSCLRTFSNGRTERWQAPRVFDPMTNDWKWEVNSCGN